MGVDGLVYGQKEETIPKLIYNIERLKYNVKRADDLEEAYSKIRNMGFLDKLIKSHLEMLKDDSGDEGVINTNKDRLPRNFNSYVESMNRLEGIRVEDNEYKNIIKQEVTYLEEVEYWRKVVYEKLPKMFEVKIAL